MKIIEKFENECGRKLKDFDEEFLISVLNNQSLSKYFTSIKTFYSILEELIYLHSGEFQKELFTIKYSFDQENAINILTEQFKQYEKEKNLEKFKAVLENDFSSSDPIFVISAYLCAMIRSEGIEFDKENIKKNVSMLKDIFNNIGRMENSYKLRCDLIDLVFQISDYYFDFFEEDILKENTWVDNEVKAVSDFEDLFLENYKIDNSRLNSTPEDAGLIDITKLKGEN